MNMESNKSIYKLLGLILLSLLTSCYSIDDELCLGEEDCNEKERIILSAIEWYGTNVNTTKSSDSWLPIWEDAVVESNRFTSVVDVPLSFFRERVFLSKGNNIGNDEINRNITRLIIEYNKEDDVYRGFIMYIVPSEEYYNSHGATLDDCYSKINLDFSGDIKYFYLNGDPFCSYTVDNGYIQEFKRGVKNSVTKASPKLECEDILTITYTEWTYNNSTIVEISNVNYSIETVCWEVGNDGLREQVTELPPKFPGGGSMALVPEYVSTVSSNIVYRDTTGMTEIENQLQQMLNDTTLKKLISYLSGSTIEFVYVNVLPNNAQMTFIYDRDADSFIIKYINGGISVGGIYHELSHAWFKINYPNSIISDEQNPEIIAVIAEFLAQRNIYGLDKVYLQGFGLGDWMVTIRDILSNPADTVCIDKFISAFQSGRGCVPPYDKLTLKKPLIYEQIKKFVELFY